MNKVSSDIKLFLKFLRHLRPWRKKGVFVFFLSVLATLLGLAMPYFGKLAVDRGLVSKDLKSFIVFGAAGTVLFLAAGFIQAVSDLLKRGIYLRVSLSLNKKIFSHLQKASLKFFQNRSTGEYMFRINCDIERVVDLVVSVPEQFIKIFPKVFFTLAVIFYLDWRMAAFSLVLAPAMYLPVYYLTAKMRAVLKDLFAGSQGIFERMEEVFSHIYLVKAFGKGKTETRSYLSALIAQARLRLKNLRLEITGSFAANGFERVVMGLITFFGGYLVIKGQMSAGTLTAIMLYLAQLVGLQRNIAGFFQSTALGLVSCLRLDEVLQEDVELSSLPAGEKRVLFKAEHISFSKVSFGYCRQEEVLKNINFDFKRGFNALAGPSGSGKTTILNLILGLYQPQEGEVCIDGSSIEEMDKTFLREQAAVVLQEPFLWNESIENNVKYARAQASIKDVTEAARIAAVDEFVRDLPEGYKTVIGENACRLSEGQKQKIALARALIKKPRILILDEAMSSMDSQSEEVIIKRIKSLPIDIIIVVSHRLSSVLACDRVYYLKGPGNMIVDEPKHLLKEDQEFYELFAGQAKEVKISQPL